MSELKRMTPQVQADAGHFAEHDALPCPFCGGHELSVVDWYDDTGEFPAIECDQCHAAAPVEIWNERSVS